MFTRRNVLALGAALVAAPGGAFAQAKTDIAISRQPGILYLPTHVIEKKKLLEKHAERLGLPGVTTKWIAFSNGGAQQDALLSGSVDIINTGTGPLLVLWDKTRGRVKGICASSAQPLLLISRDPRIKSLADFGEGDKIAVPTVRVSTQAILLQLAASQMFGPDKWNHFDAMTVQLGHPDAFVALKNPSHEVKSHFAAPPFQAYGLKQVPGAHVVANSAEIIGSPLSQGQFMTTTGFAEANPKIVQALRAAAEEAKAFVETNTAEALEIYREVTGDKTSTADLLDVLKEPGMMEWNIYPQGTMTFATHLAKIGAIKNQPASWKDYYLPVAHDLPGN
ncbi:ABC transporter substrate-binding protein [Prosthecomicrobium hirschii]|uniref:ABC transporter substrate-binding protein n=1 Tax=Prosthecodimorpha hirschii TaxID=665126 RepID=UPI00221E4CEB|nr:ABC transporter substrate-binding protein [Prosthecomicrobium hirschii]MCW1842358.1 ABC transporter substrate-binding protein [Prosthecomicrobium hirschii]